MNRFALAAALAFGVGSAHATVVDLFPQEPAARAQPVRMQRVPDLALAPAVPTVLPAPRMSELPEPEVFAMMLLGLVLIGYRARRDSSEKFK